MTDFNKRLDEILQNHFRGYAARSFPEYQDNASEIWNNSVEKAKQALTSLIKEMVAEARPEIPVATSWQQGIEKKAFEDAIRVYEYKLLNLIGEKE